jgi:predicted CxxxxCH...CXXCH cytochrome family protein
VPVPGVDFAFTSYPVAYPAYALNLGRSFKTVGWGDPPLSCAGCHDSPVRSAAPAVLASAGQSHSWLDGSGAESGHGWNHGWAPLACRTCHAQTVSAANATSRIGANVSVYGDVPITGFGAHVDGNPDVAFDPSVAVQYRSSFSLSSASYDPTTATCSNVACHLNQTAVKHGTPSRPITVTIECNTCHQY